MLRMTGKKQFRVYGFRLNPMRSALCALLLAKKDQIDQKDLSRLSRVLGGKSMLRGTKQTKKTGSIVREKI